MANSSTHFIVMAILVTVGIQILSDKMVSAQCESQIFQLVSKCSKFVQKIGPEIPPSPECCQVVQNANIPCVCSKVTLETEKKISAKVINVATKYGVEVKPGFKCGSKFIATIQF